MLTVTVQGQLMSVVDEERTMVDRETGKTRQYQKRTCRFLVDGEFLIVSANEGVVLPSQADAKKTFSVQLSKFENERDVVRGIALSIIPSKG